MRKWLKRIGWFIGVIVLVSAAFFGALMWLVRRQQIEPDTASTPSRFTAANVTAPSSTATAPIATDDDPSIGPKDAAVTIVEFSDFECPYCKQAFPIVRELMAAYGDRVRFIYRDFPVSSIHENAQKAAEAGECAQAQGKFWALHDKIFQNAPRITPSELKQYAKEAGLDTAAFDACLDNGQFANEVQQDLADGLSLGVRGTPTWFVNGRKVEGVIPRAVFVKLLDQLLAVPKK